MSNRRLGRRRKQYISPEGREHPSKYTDVELHQILVADAVRRHPTDVRWAFDAYRIIGKRRHGSESKGSEIAFIAVLDEVEQLTGLREMPIG